MGAIFLSRKAYWRYYSRFLLGAGHIGTLCLATAEILEGKQVVCYKSHITNSLGTLNYSYQLGNRGTTH